MWVASRVHREISPFPRSPCSTQGGGMCSKRGAASPRDRFGGTCSGGRLRVGLFLLEASTRSFCTSTHMRVHVFCGTKDSLSETRHVENLEQFGKSDLRQVKLQITYFLSTIVLIVLKDT